MKIESESELERLGQAREAEVKFVREQNEIEISKEKELTAISVGKVSNYTYNSRFLSLLLPTYCHHSF